MLELDGRDGAERSMHVAFADQPRTPPGGGQNPHQIRWGRMLACDVQPQAE